MAFDCTREAVATKHSVISRTRGYVPRYLLHSITKDFGQDFGQRQRSGGGDPLFECACLRLTPRPVMFRHLECGGSTYLEDD